MKKRRTWIGTGVFVASLLLMTAGILRGELAVMFIKAINICLECIGLG